jgi:type IV pilus assembly protein PilA
MSSTRIWPALPRHALDGMPPALIENRMRPTRRQGASRRGFTLVELLIVVAMVGVLAALAMVGYRKYINSAGTAEAAVVMQGIRGGEEAFKSEMLVYLSCSTSMQDNFYPQGSQMPDSRKWNWSNPAHSDYARWRQLNVTTDGAVKFGYAVMSGVAGVTPPTLHSAFRSVPTWPTTLQPWYVIEAYGDRDEDTVPALFLTSSFHNEIYSENDTE